MVFKTVESQFPASGPCRIAVVGDHPAEEDVIEGRLFAGSTGRVLRMMLRQGGVDPATCYIGNVFRQRPLANDISKFFLKKLEAKGVVAHTHGFVKRVAIEAVRYVPDSESDEKAN